MGMLAGHVRGPAAQRPVVRVVAGATTLNPRLEQGIVITGPGTVTLTAPVAGDIYAHTLVWVKRTSNNPLHTVQVAGVAIDGAPGNNIQLGTSSRFGTLTGESAWFWWDGASWRAIAGF